MKILSLVFLALSACASSPQVVPREISVAQEFETKTAPEVVREVPKPIVKKIAKKIVIAKVETPVEKADAVVPFKVGEELKFKAFLRGINVGSATFAVRDTKYIQNQAMYHFYFAVKTEGMIKKFFNLSIEQQSFVDKKELKTYKFQSDIIENDKVKQSVDLYDYNKKQVFSKTVKDQKQEDKTLSLTNDLFDTLSAFYRLRVDPRVRSLKVVYEGSVKEAKISFEGDERLSVQGKDVDTKKYVLAIEGTSGRQTVWLDVNKSIVQVFVETNAGVVKLVP